MILLKETSMFGQICKKFHQKNKTKLYFSRNTVLNAITYNTNFILRISFLDLKILVEFQSFLDCSIDEFG
jgi:hypothetical protein